MKGVCTANQQWQYSPKTKNNYHEVQQLTSQTLEKCNDGCDTFVEEFGHAEAKQGEESSEDKATSPCTHEQGYCLPLRSVDLVEGKVGIT